MDFFEREFWVRCSTMFTEGGTFIITDGGHTSDMFMEGQADKIRYYAQDSKICQLPFIHIRNLASVEAIPIVSLPDDMSTQFGECQWCCRYFPCDGMLKCTNDDIANSTARSFCYYCNEECKTRGMSVHAGTGDLE